jgi:probable F420-dependent oxidoreductase
MSPPMNLGFGAPVAGSWATPENLAEIARRAEELGYSSLWSFSRILFPDAPGEDRLQSVYRSVHDPLVVAAFLAAITSRVRLGMAVINMPFYPPLVLAKALTSIDVVSHGRLDAGLGLGWSAAEFAAAGVDMARRGARAEEYLRCLRAAWTQDPVEFAGDFYQIPRGWVDPKPVQSPHPPILLGADSTAALARVGRLADGWISSSRTGPARIAQSIATIRAAAETTGRDPTALRFIARAPLRLRAVNRVDDPALTGTADKIRAGIQEYFAAGATEVFLDVNYDEEVGTAEADPARSMEVARAVLETFAPGR